MSFKNFKSIYNKFEDGNTNDTEIQRLLQLTQFSNAKMADRISQFRQKNYEIMEELLNPGNFEMIEELSYDYASRHYQEASYNFIINIDKDNDTDDVYKLRKGVTFEVKFSGIIEFLSPKVFEAINRKYLDSYSKLCTIFTKRRKNNSKRIIQMSQKSPVFTKFVNQSYRANYPLIFHRNCNEDVKRILFNAYIGTETPRSTDVEDFQKQVNTRVSEMINGKYLQGNTTVFEKQYEKLNKSDRLKKTISKMVDSV